MENNIKSGLENFMIPTENRPYTSIEGISGVGFKPMNVLEQEGIWSSTILIKKGMVLPSRANTGLCEFLVIHGEGKFESGEQFKKGDYFRESVGEYVSIEAKSDLVLFVTNHGETQFKNRNAEILWVANSSTIKELSIN